VEADLSGVLKAVGTIAGIVAMVPSPIQPIAAAVAIAANIGAALTAKRPTAKGSQTDITIGANMSSDMILGQSYSGGKRVHLAGYGTENDVPNAYLLAVDVYGVGGPYQSLVATFGDFTAISFDGLGKAIGFYSNNTLYRDYQLGETPEATALAPHWTGAPDWGSSYKLSGKAAVLWNARFPKDGKRYGSGFFQTGAEWQGIKLYDPRLDSSYPGGSGPHRWASPSDTTAFAAAKATWTYSRNPGLHALRYALGTWERDETDADAAYVKVFGLGLEWDAIDVVDCVALANVCDDNEWTCNGILSEPGDKWENLKNILQAGAAEPCFKNGRLGFRINAPRVALDTITRDDLADGDLVVPAMQTYRDRLNTIIPKYRSPDHKWEYVATQEVIQVTQFVTEDGEEKTEERQYNLVTNPVQAAQLGAYGLVGGREAGPIEMVCKPRLRGYSPGDLVTVDIPEAGLDAVDCVILNRTIDPATMTVSLSLVTENPDKHDYALAQTGSAPPAITISGPDETDDVAGADPAAASVAIRGAYIKVAGDLLSAIDAGADATVTIAAHDWDYPGQGADVHRESGDITGLDYGTAYFAYFDDATLADETPPYAVTLEQSEALNSTAHPYRHYLGTVTTPTSGGPPTGGGGGGGGYCVVPETPILMADQTSKPAGSILRGEWVWTQHEETMAWGNFPVTAVKRVPCANLFEATIEGKVLRGSPDHPVWLDGEWITLDQIGTPAGAGVVVMLTVAAAHTYVANGVLSHNKEVDPPVGPPV
jgi:hypothetical protein